jgi:hypothetical protein
MKNYLLIIILACMSFSTYAQIREQSLSTTGLPITFDVLLAGPDDRYAYVPPGECAPSNSCEHNLDFGYFCNIPRDAMGQYQDFWFEIWGPGSTEAFFLLCRFWGQTQDIIYITRSDHTWDLAVPDPEQDVLEITPPPSIGNTITIDFDRSAGRVHLRWWKPGYTLNIIPPCETENPGDGIGDPALRMANTGANTSPIASRTAANAGLNTGKVATPAMPGLSQSLLRFPNPISASLTITWGNEAPADTELSLWSLDGRRIVQGSLGTSDADYTFPTAHLPAGVYLLRVVSAGQIPQTYKIVKN